MFRQLRSNLVRLGAVVALLIVPVMVPAAASADIQSCVAQGTNLDVNLGANGGCPNSETTGSTLKINSLIHTIINIFSLIVGVTAVVMIIVGGLRYITSGGDSGNVSAAKNTIIYAIIGLVVVALAQFIVQFVVNKVTGS